MQIAIFEDGNVPFSRVQNALSNTALGTVLQMEQSLSTRIEFPNHFEQRITDIRDYGGSLIIVSDLALDLGSLENKLRERIFREYKTEVPVVITDSQLGGIVLCLETLKNTSIEPVVINIATNGHVAGVLTFLRRAAQEMGRDLKKVVIQSNGCALTGQDDSAEEILVFGARTYAEIEPSFVWPLPTTPTPSTQSAMHPDPAICRALDFYKIPFETRALDGLHFWEHDKLHVPGTQQWTEAARWLDLIDPPETGRDAESSEANEPLPGSDLTSRAGTDGESPKALLALDLDGDSPVVWKKGGFRFSQRVTRSLTGRALKKLFENLDIKVNNANEIKPDDDYRMPCNPCLPFFISLRSLLYNMENDPLYAAPKEILFNRTPDHMHDLNIYSISIKLDQLMGDEKSHTPPWGLAKSYWNTAGGSSSQTTTGSLCDLTLAKTNFKQPKKQPKTSLPGWMKVFVNGGQIIDAIDKVGEEQLPHYLELEQRVGVPVVTLEFAPFWIHIMWTARLDSHYVDGT